MTPGRTMVPDLGLGLLCLALAGVLAWTLHDGLEAGEPAARPVAGTAVPAAGSAFALPPLERFAAVTARPLFVPERRPAAPQAPAATVAAADPELVGFLAERGRRRAVLRLADGRTVTLGAGETALGWRIVRIEGDTVGVERDGPAREGGTRELRPAPRVPRSGPAETAASPVPPPPLLLPSPLPLPPRPGGPPRHPD